MVGQKDEPSIVLGIVKRDATQRIRVETRCLRTDQHDGLVASQPGCLVDPAPAATPEVEAPLGAGHEECRTGREPMKALEIDRSSIHDTYFPQVAETISSGFLRLACAAVGPRSRMQGRSDVSARRSVLPPHAVGLLIAPRRRGGSPGAAAGRAPHTSGLPRSPLSFSSLRPPVALGKGSHPG